MGPRWLMVRTALLARKTSDPMCHVVRRGVGCFTDGCGFLDSVCRSRTNIDPEDGIGVDDFPFWPGGCRDRLAELDAFGRFVGRKTD